LQAFTETCVIDPKEEAMLVLSRKEGQSIVIAGEIVVNVREIGRGRVQIGVVAPPHLSIHREEIHRRIQREQQLVAAGGFSNAGEY
jgi:carbon storage regulator